MGYFYGALRGYLTDNERKGAPGLCPNDAKSPHQIRILRMLAQIVDDKTAAGDHL